MAGNEFTSIIKVIERENELDQDLHDKAEKVFGGMKIESIRATLQNGIDRRNRAIAILTKAAEEPEVEWFHSFFEDGSSATKHASEGSARSRMEEMGGYVLTRPKPEPFTVVAGTSKAHSLPYGENEY